MSKIRDLDFHLQAGARNNKYRVLFPTFGREIDILTHDIVSPSMSIGVAEVFLKGRKYQLAGDRSDEGSISMTIYNDPELGIRTFLQEGIKAIQDFETPSTIYGPGSGFGGMFSLFGGALPYQGDIVIQQLDHDEQIVNSVILHESFVTEVGSIEYQDEVGDVSTTQITIAYTGLTIE